MATAALYRRDRFHATPAESWPFRRRGEVEAELPFLGEADEPAAGLRSRLRRRSLSLAG
jgi:hypothetical protein